MFRPICFFVSLSLFVGFLQAFLSGKLYVKEGVFNLTEKSEFAFMAFCYGQLILSVVFFALSCSPKTKAELESEQKRARGETFQTGKCPTCKEVYDSERFDLYECPTCNEKLIEVGKYYDLHPEERG